MAEMVTPPDVVAVLLRPLSSAETDSFERLSRQAQSQLRAAMPSVDERVAAFSAEPPPPTALDPVIVAGVLAGAIARVYNNPKGLWSASETTGPFTHSETYPGQRAGSGADTVTVGVRITAEDLAALAPPARARRLGTIRLGAAFMPPDPGPC